MFGFKENLRENKENIYIYIYKRKKFQTHYIYFNLSI